MNEERSSEGLQSIYSGPCAVDSEPIHELCGGSGITVRALGSGAIHSISGGELPITLYEGSALEGGPTNLYLRILDGDRVESWVGLLGASAGEVRFGEDRMMCAGEHAGISYIAELRLSGGSGWSWCIRLRNRTGGPIVCDVVYVQDVGLSNAPNEAYVSQYVDHKVLEHPDLGPVICSRQNLLQKGCHPWLMIGCMQGARGFAADAFDFFGCGYRVTHRPAVLDLPVLPSAQRQYEFSACILQSESVPIPPQQTASIDFFAEYDPDHPEPTSDLDLGRVPDSVPSKPGSGDCLPGSASPVPQSMFANAVLAQAEDLSDSWVSEYWSVRHHAETDESAALLSFFAGEGAHVVLKAKEVIQERPTGAIIRSGAGLVGEAGIISATAYMRGVFLSQLALGNLSFNVVLSIRKDPLGVLLAGGMRVFVERSGRFELLGVPSAFENTLNGCRWLYHINEDVVDVRVSADPDTHMVCFEAQTRRPMRLRLAMGIVMGSPGEETPLSRVMRIDEKAITLRPPPGSRFREQNPDPAVHIVPGDPGKLSRIGGDELLFSDGVSRGVPCLVMDTGRVENFRLGFTGSLDKGVDIPPAGEIFARYGSFDRISSRGRELCRRLTSGLDFSSKDDRIARMATVMPWFVHNAVIHLSAPHGLEQYMGGAWGTRDVCQGPLEMLLALDREKEVRRILETVFANQHADGGWPQWFMYDSNSEIRAGDAHGDVVFWPISALCDYVESTGDTGLLDVALPYHDSDDPAETVFEHVLRALRKIRNEFVSGSSLVAYGHGDWNDSLQPADPALAERMISSWTAGLSYQVIEALARVCRLAGCTEAAEKLGRTAEHIRRDFNELLVHGGVVCGFGLLDDLGWPTPLLHPDDARTGIHYRLLPMIRGILSGIFSPEQARSHADLISAHLLCPDGARLMDHPPRYDGGRQHIFQRAETSTFFGREIGIMYVHAHIRYAQAMACLGRAEELLTALMTVVPVEIEKTVSNAVLRQRNAYFSSSDAAFTNRDEADREYRRVTTGNVPVRGGWRIYSSGPGLFVSLILRHLLGLRRYADGFVFDPVLPRDLDGLSVEWELRGRPVRIQYRVEQGSFGPRTIEVEGKETPAEREESKYRTGGLRVKWTELERRLTSGRTDIRVVL